jgi:hypothetical protein
MPTVNRPSAWRIGSGSQEQCVGRAEHRHAGSGAERDRQHGDRHESGVLDQQPRTVPQILPEVVEEVHLTVRIALEDGSSNPSRQSPRIEGQYASIGGRSLQTPMGEIKKKGN